MLGRRRGWVTPGRRRDWTDYRAVGPYSGRSARYRLRIAAAALQIRRE
jgi:hypothetical protein